MAKSKTQKFLDRVIPRYTQLLIPAALVATLMCFVPELRFDTDPGLNYMREFKMYFTHVDNIYHSLTTTEVFVYSTIKIMPAAIVNILIIVTSLIAALFGPVKRLFQLIACDLAIALNAAFIGLVVYDAVRISSHMFATVFLSGWSVLPVITLVMLLSSRRRIQRRIRMRVKDDLPLDTRRLTPKEN